MIGDLLAAEEHILKDVKIESRMVTTSVIIPAYNEEKGLAIVLEKIFRATNGNCEVIVVDDGSDDATWEVASEFACRQIRHGTNRGKGEALKTGLSHSRGDYVIFIDADDTYPSEAIPEMAEALETYDMVYCSRSNGRVYMPRLNRIGNKIFQSLIRHIYGFKVSDYSTGLYGMKKHHLETMNISSRGFAIEPEIAIKASRMKLRMKEIPVLYRPRVGQTKLSSLGAGFEHMKVILGLIFWRPPHRKP